MPSFKPRFPTYNVKDKDQIVDAVGNIYEYDIETDSWLLVGEIKIPDIVTEENDGIASSEIYRRIYVLQKLYEKGTKFDAFKLDYKTEKAPYYYYFHSSDDLVRFIPEAKDQLRIEVDRDRLFNRLLSTCCVGPVGKTGEDGDPGEDGKSAANEFFKQPTSFVDNLYILSDIVNTPIDTPISIRLFKDDIQISEVIYNLDGSFTVDEFVNATMSSVSYNTITKVLNASLKIIGSFGELKHKTRQVGEKGLPGNDGKGFFDLSIQVLDNADLKSSEVIANIRKSSINNSIYVLNKDISDEFCTVNLNTIPLVSPIDNIYDTTFCSVEMSTKECKYMGHYKLPEKVIEEEKLDLAAWTPTADCVQAKRYHQYKFDWYNFTDIKYSHKILNNPRPGQIANCDCVENFFMCNNAGDQSCGIIGTPPAPKLKAPDLDCQCDSPNIEAEQGNGMVLAASDLCAACGEVKYEDVAFSTLSNVGSAGSVSVTGVVNGNINRFKYFIKVCGKCELDFIFKKDSNVCGGESIESGDPLYVSSDLVHGTIELKSKNGIAQISQDGIGEFVSINSVVVFTVDTTASGAVDGIYVSDDIEVDVVINDNKANYCYGYRLTIDSGCECSNVIIEPEVPPEEPPIIEPPSTEEIPPTITIVPGEDLVARITPNSLDFGTVFVNSTQDLTLTIENVGQTQWSGSATVSPPFLIVDGSTYNLAPGESQVITVRFSPLVSNDYSGTVFFSGGTTLVCSLIGTGIPELIPFIEYLDPNLDGFEDNSWNLFGAATVEDALNDITRNPSIPPLVSGIICDVAFTADTDVSVENISLESGSVSSVTLHFYVVRNSGTKIVTGKILIDNAIEATTTGTTTGWYSVTADLTSKGWTTEEIVTHLNTMQIRLSCDNTAASSSSVCQAYIEVNGHL